MERLTLKSWREGKGIWFLGPRLTGTTPPLGLGVARAADDHLRTQHTRKAQNLLDKNGMTAVPAPDGALAIPDRDLRHSPKSLNVQPSRPHTNPPPSGSARTSTADAHRE